MNFRKLGNPRPEATNHPAEALGGLPSLLGGRTRGLGVRQLLRDLREVDFQVMEKYVMHEGSLAAYRLSKVAEPGLSRVLRQMVKRGCALYKLYRSHSYNDPVRGCPGLVISH
jgi:hypothetical protein